MMGLGLGLGRVRSSSPLEVLEMERLHRPSSKIIKHDSLSIYEATLLKLKQGSHSISQEMPIDAPLEMGNRPSANAADADFSSPDCSTSTTTCQSPCSNNMSILSFFSKCKTPPNAQSSSNKEPTAASTSSSPFAINVSPTSCTTS